MPLVLLLLLHAARGAIVLQDNYFADANGWRGACLRCCDGETGNVVLQPHCHSAAGGVQAWHLSDNRVRWRRADGQFVCAVAQSMEALAPIGVSECFSPSLGATLELELRQQFCLYHFFGARLSYI